MFTAYVDDSGTSPSQSVAIATAAVVPALQIHALEKEWKTFAHKEGFSSFHMAEFVARNSKSEFADWDIRKQTRVVTRIIQISRKYGILSFSFAVHKQDYDDIVVGEWREHFGKDHYVWAVRHLIWFLDQWRLPRVTEPLEYVFDWINPKEERRKEIELVMEQAESLAVGFNRGGDYKNYRFCHRQDSAGLQCVDVLGWVCYQISLLNFKKKPCNKFAADAIKDCEKGGWLVLRTVVRENLQEWFSAETKDEGPRALREKWQNDKSKKT